VLRTVTPAQERTKCLLRQRIEYLRLLLTSQVMVILLPPPLTVSLPSGDTATDHIQSLDPSNTVITNITLPTFRICSVVSGVGLDRKIDGQYLRRGAYVVDLMCKAELNFYSQPSLYRCIYVQGACWHHTTLLLRRRVSLLLSFLPPFHECPSYIINPFVLSARQIAQYALDVCAPFWNNCS
jgi:hypothetical protein